MHIFVFSHKECDNISLTDNTASCSSPPLSKLEAPGSCVCYHHLLRPIFTSTFFCHKISLSSILHVLWPCLGTCSIVFTWSEICFLSHRPCSSALSRSQYRPLSILHLRSATCALSPSHTHSEWLNTTQADFFLINGRSETLTLTLTQSFWNFTSWPLKFHGNFLISHLLLQLWKDIYVLVTSKHAN